MTAPVSGAKRLIDRGRKEELILALTGNGFFENQFILSEMFLIEYNNELVLNPINILVPSV